ncbi:bleomycin resistance protein [Streptomyces sp. CC53]|uniref:VOC family protein n=1 Tax=unclassified Streptomyces TaxID=2593676 RepID=UPI0008DE6AE0|nr:MULTISPECIES: VOC family protein [unclassified Streptomyces]OII64025.1 bleomycin resistance protein [Streptomyces sp. CC53]OII68198.1 bleomycin resistance protein [Streptomyces sp. CC77]
MTNVFVDDEQKAHAFYTDVLGFETRAHIDLGEALFVTVGAPGQDVELLLEPGDSPVARAYTKGLREAGLPCIVFAVDDLRAEYERLRALGVAFTQEPVEQGPVLTAVLDDTVGNLVQLTQRLG